MAKKARKILCRAVAKGYINHAIREPGDTFWTEPERFADNWMEQVATEEAPPPEIAARPDPMRAVIQGGEETQAPPDTPDGKDVFGG